MNIQEFETVCRESKAQPICRLDTPEGVTVIADGDNPTYGQLVQDGALFMKDDNKFRTTWAHGRTEDDLQIGRPLFFGFTWPDSDKVTTQKHRVEAAAADAKIYAESRGVRR